MAPEPGRAGPEPRSALLGRDPARCRSRRRPRSRHGGGRGGEQRGEDLELGDHGGGRPSPLWSSAPGREHDLVAGVELVAASRSAAVDAAGAMVEKLLTGGTCRDRRSVVTTKLTALQEARQSLQEAARLFGEAPPPDASLRFADLFLRRAAIEFTRELLCALLGFNHSDLEERIDDLMNLADASLKARGGITDPQLGKEVRAYLAKWDLL